MNQLVIGVDYGSDSARAVVVDAVTGARLGTGVCAYPRWAKGLYCDPAKHIFRQHPLDYTEALENSVRDALREAGEGSGQFVCGIAVDTTGSTPAPVDEEGTPLALLPAFAGNPDAMFYLWKDHSANEEAKEINRVFADSAHENYLRYQGDYSAEWYWAKILHCRRTAPAVCEAAAAWVEHSDWIPALLCGNTAPGTIVRNATGAGHKAYWHSAFGGLPARAVLESLDPYLAKLADGFRAPETGGKPIGKITPEWAARLGVSEDAVIGTAVFDAHAAGLGAGIRPGYLVKVIGTSTVDMLIARPEELDGMPITDVCGCAENSIVPGFIGVESGQSAFGDLFSWFRSVLMWPVRDFLAGTDLPEDEKSRLAEAYSERVIADLSDEASRQDPDENLVALDWLNGRRYPKTDNGLRGMMAGMTLGTTAPGIYGALALAAVFGSKRIFETFTGRGMKIEGIIAVGGIARKSPYIMQMLADCLGRPIEVSGDSQASASGAAICAAAAAGIYGSIPEACEHLCMATEAVYEPRQEKRDMYERLYRKYLKLGAHEEAFLKEAAGIH